ncbi:nitrous oxide-stimulated promoter family protein [Paramuribaculum intestinale]|uniref:nitrous oxide-stimulated promoter family protein n=1 Tax=Paramuribaculum intestinale TaxID=2094151 RepID=UPI002617B297|nr:nitrous oxide-stimulated promoter family protein [Paramuribaculum intestinale]
MKKTDREIRTVTAMIALYCRHKEGNRELCDDCASLTRYAAGRLRRCPFGENKTACRDCPVHCYSPAMRERIRAVMRYAGPRMILYHPVAALRHFFGK